MLDTAALGYAGPAVRRRGPRAQARPQEPQGGTQVFQSLVRTRPKLSFLLFIYVSLPSRSCIGALRVEIRSCSLRL